MSKKGLSKIFGGKKKEPPAPSCSDVLERLHETETMLLKKQQFLEHKINQELASAKMHATTNRQLALKSLKRKRQFEMQLQKVDGTLSTLEFQRDALDNAATNSHVMGVMTEASRAMQSANRLQNVDQVHNIMDDIQEQQEIAQEIGDAISSPSNLPASHQYDDDELLAELEDLERDDNLSSSMASTSLTDRLPAAPTTSLPSRGEKSKEQRRRSQLNEREAYSTAL